MKKLVIFDLDGTLLNTYEDIAAATNYALSQYGYPTHSTPVIKSFVGNGINKLFERALPEDEKTEENILKIRAAFIPYYNVHGADFTMPFEGIVELLYTLQRLGLKLAVASNKYEQATKALVETYFPEIEWCAVFGQRESVPTKPDPTIVEEILEKAGISNKEEVLYVGDSGVDMQTAINAGVEGVGVTWGCRSREELESFSPRAVVNTCEEILQIVTNL
ncbi:MAG: HAD family hydrolase [Paludibacteraceae bacterium]|nr:HAD family hydrolase [Paludibacteraceae bacterium]